MKFYALLYAATLAAFFIIDIIWLGLVAKNLYGKYLGYLLAPRTNWAAVIIFYLLFVGGILFFVVLPGLQSGDLKATLIRAALYGLITYATYDLTNLATVKDWPLKITLIDMAWGTVLSLSVSYVSYLVGNWLR
ncbi:MAG TPA: DUF2177 family protein [Anaerolineaceae bacterium]|nr:DUF2177 family protein [Anaerolineaceae bacterium]